VNVVLNNIALVIHKRDDDDDVMMISSQCVDVCENNLQ